MRITLLTVRLASATLFAAIGLGIGSTGVAAAATPNANDGRTVNLHISVQPSAAAPGASFTDAIMVTNVGQDSAHDVQVTVPFDASSMQLLGVQFNQPDSWVTSVGPNQFQARLGGIGGDGAEAQMIVSFADLQGHAPANALPTPIAYRYSDNGKTHSGTINTELLPAQASAVAQPSAVTMTVAGGSDLQINSAIFAPGEAVAFWYNTPDGQALPLYIRSGKITIDRQHKVTLTNGTTEEHDNGAYLSADSQGTIAAPLSTGGIAPGVYSLVAHGTSSSATAVFTFQVM